MKKIIILSFVWMIAFQAYSYDQEQLDQFRNTNFCIHCNLIEAFLNEENHNHALLTESDLSEARIKNAQFNEAEITACQFVRANVDGSSFRKAKLDGTNFSFFSGRYAAFNSASFKNANLTHTRLYAANFAKADFTDADLEDADLNNTILIGSNLTQEQLAKVKNLNCAVLPEGRVYNPGKRKCREF